MKRIILFVYLLITIVSNLTAEEEFKIYFRNLHRLTRENQENTTPLYKLNFDTLRVKVDSIISHDKLIPIKLPDMKNSSDTAFFREFFTGWENSVLGRMTMFLVGDYKSDTTYIWADLNNNLDFTDDNAVFTITKDNPIIYIDLPNSNYPEGKFLYKFSKKRYKDTAHKNEIKEYYYNDDKKKGFRTTECEFWFATTRLNILSCDTIIDGNKIQLGLKDCNCNGLYNDLDTVSEDNFFPDRILTGNYGSEIISDKPSAGAAVLLPETFIPIQRKLYKVIEVEPTGKYIIIKKTDKKYSSLKIGDPLPDLEFSLFNGEKTSLVKQIIKGKYNLIDFWGFWCKGCMLAVPKLKELDSLYHEKLNIIGLHDNKSDKEKAVKAVTNYHINWTVGYLTPEIYKEVLLQEHFLIMY
ncbi:MAG: Thioredoxin protein [Ignavibacteria bacterium]|nr:Thioredoxin protein [Ignavibacteria bacterium]